VDPDAAPDLVRWINSGMSALSGREEQPLTVPPPGFVGRLDGVVEQIAGWSALVGSEVRLDWGKILTERAGYLGLRRRGRTSANGSCRLLRARDGWVAVNLSRPDDLAMIDALLGTKVTDPWPEMAAATLAGDASTIVGRARLLGLPAAVLGSVPSASPPARVTARGAPSGRRSLRGARVVDLSSLWAGPLAARVLGLAGAEVVKVDSNHRPGGGHRSSPFHRSLHPLNQKVVFLDFTLTSGRTRLRDLLSGADIVIEGSRPRALEHLGADPGTLEASPGQVWLSITGYGREYPGRDWVAFGDDAAAAGGLVGWVSPEDPVFCGDAVADPVTGLIGAATVLTAVAEGGGQLIDLAMSRAAASIVTGRHTL
jgi:hypothetical protein